MNTKPVRQFGTPEMRAKYAEKRKELEKRNQSDKKIEEDAFFIFIFGLSAYLELVPQKRRETKGYFLKIAQKIRQYKRREMLEIAQANALANSATKSKKGRKAFENFSKKIK